MLFDDLFYPGNRKKREEVLILQIEITNAFKDYKRYWNNWAGLLNDAFAACPFEPYKSFRITTLSKNIEKDTIKDCLDEITTAAGQTNPTMKRVLEAMGIDNLSGTVTGSSAFLGALVAGALGGLVFGAAFVITDVISSAISGAVKRKELNEALDALRELKEKVADPLKKQAVNFECFCTNSLMMYSLGDGFILAGQPDGSYAILKCMQL